MLKIKEGLRTNTAILDQIDKYGQRVTVDMPITDPNGKTAVVRTGKEASYKYIKDLIQK